MITAAQLVALLPLIVLSTGTVAVMLAIAFRRDHALIFSLTVLSLVVTLVAVIAASGLAPKPVTALLIMDQYALFFIGLTSAGALATVALCAAYLEIRPDPPEEFYVLVLTGLLGAGVLVASSHFASLFLGLEILSVSLFALIAYPRWEKRALEAAVKYLVLSGVSSGLLLFGMALVYAELGVLEFAAMRVPALTFPVVAGILMIVSALGFKLSLVPFHLWTADVYQGAPAPVTALLATVSKGAVFALLLRYGVAGGVVWHPALLKVVTLIAAASILVGNLLALRQNNLKRILAYSSIAHMGYLLIALVAAGRIGASLAAESMAFYLAAYFVTTLAAFGVIMVLSPANREAEFLEDYTGLFWTRPGLATVLTVAILSLAGIPLTAGFIGKFYLFAAGSAGSLWTLLALLIVGSGIGLYYYLRVVFQMTQAPLARTHLPIDHRDSLGGNLVLALLTFLMIGLGIAPSQFINTILPVSQSISVATRIVP